MWPAWKTVVRSYNVSYEEWKWAVRNPHQVQFRTSRDGKKWDYETTYVLPVTGWKETLSDEIIDSRDFPKGTVFDSLVHIIYPESCRRALTKGGDKNFQHEYIEIEGPGFKRQNNRMNECI